MAEHIHVKAETRGPYERADRAAAFIEVCRCGAERYSCSCAPCKSRGTNVTRWKTRPTTRHALILVTTELDYLTANGEETEESGWDEVAKNLAGYLEGFNKFQNATRPFAKFIEWDEEDSDAP